MISELFEMVDNIIITAGILCGIIVVVSIVYAVVSCLIQEKKERQKRKQEEELRQKRLSKIAIKDRKCSTCRYGEKEEEFSTDIIVIGNPLMLSPDFPPLHTGRESFPSSGVPSSVTSTF